MTSNTKAIIQHTDGLLKKIEALTAECRRIRAERVEDIKGGLEAASSAMESLGASSMMEGIDATMKKIVDGLASSLQKLTVSEKERIDSLATSLHGVVDEAANTSSEIIEAHGERIRGIISEMDAKLSKEVRPSIDLVREDLAKTRETLERYESAEDHGRISALEAELADEKKRSAEHLSELFILRELADDVEKHVFRREEYIWKTSTPGTPPEVQKGLVQQTVEENTAIIKACVNWIATNRMGKKKPAEVLENIEEIAKEPKGPEPVTPMEEIEPGAEEGHGE
jgi:BMFP domain-containing protein YqiC